MVIIQYEKLTILKFIPGICLRECVKKKCEYSADDH